MPRRVYLLGVAVALVGLALGFTDWALSLPPGVTETNVRRIRPGMTLAEVEALFGSRGYIPFIPCARHGEDNDPPRPGEDLRVWRCWQGREGSARVIFDDDDRVAEIRFTRHSSTDGPLARLRAWLGR